MSACNEKQRKNMPWPYGDVPEHTLTRPGAPVPAWCWLPQSRPTPVTKRIDRFLRDLCRKCVVSRRTLRSMMGQDGCRFLPPLQTHYGVKVEA